MSRLFLQLSTRLTPQRPVHGRTLAWHGFLLIASVFVFVPASDAVSQENIKPPSTGALADAENKATSDTNTASAPSAAAKGLDLNQEPIYLRISKSDEGKAKALETAIRRYTAKPGDRYPMLKSIWSA